LELRSEFRLVPPVYPAAPGEPANVVELLAAERRPIERENAQVRNGRDVRAAITRLQAHWCAQNRGAIAHDRESAEALNERRPLLFCEEFAAALHAGGRR